MINKFISLFLLVGTSLLAQCYEFQSSLIEPVPSVNQIYIEPIYARAKYKSQNLKQKGNLYGITANYDFILYNAPYCGFESYYKVGTLKSQEINSKYKDYCFEGKVGYTMGIPYNYSFIPYLAIGYENIKNDYKNNFTNKLSYYYLATGINTHVFIMNNFSFGCNIKLIFPIDGSSKVKNNEAELSVTISKKVQYNVEVPLTYSPSSAFSFSIVPFYDYKNINNIHHIENLKTRAKMSEIGLGLRANFCF